VQSARLVLFPFPLGITETEDHSLYAAKAGDGVTSVWGLKPCFLSNFRMSFIAAPPFASGIG